MSTQCLHVTDHNSAARISRSGQLNLVYRALHRLLNSVQLFYRTRREQKISRDALAQLNELDDSLLRDIGLNKGDVQWANQLPLSVNAAIELRKIADQRRQCWNG